MALDVTENDRDALKLAIEQARAQGAGLAQQIDRMLADTDWIEVGMFAAACCQRQALRLKPWRIPPCRIRDPDHPDRGRDRRYGEIDGRHDAARLLRQMYDLGISRWHPDPLAAIEEKKTAIEGKKDRSHQWKRLR
jgi:hypothetical protein